MIFNSMNDKVKNFLEKVLDRLKKQTQFENRSDSRMVYWAYPFHDTLSTALPYRYINKDIKGSHFFKHCRDVYGLKYHEIEYIWERYYEWISDEIYRRNTSNS